MYYIQNSSSQYLAYSESAGLTWVALSDFAFAFETEDDRDVAWALLLTSGLVGGGPVGLPK